jgi:general secretion pathway protein D
MTKLFRIASWLLLPILATACATTEPIATIPKVSPWKTVPLPLVEADSAGITPSPTAALASRTEFFETSPAPPDITRTALRTGPERAGERYELNFNDADIRGVINAVLGDMLKLDYVIAPNVQGRITFRTSRPIAQTALLPALEAALSSVSAAIVKTDQTVHVVPMDEAPQRMRGAHRIIPSAPQTPGFAVEILPLRYVNANEMKTVLESFVPKGTVLQADVNHGHLVIAGSSQDRAAVLRTVENFDVDWLQGMSFALYRLEQSRADVIVAELRNIFQGPLDLLSNRVRLVPLERMQSVLGMARNKSDLELLSQWIARLDVSKSGDSRIFVYNVQNGSAKDLVSALRQVLTGETAVAQGRGDQAASTVQTPGGFQQNTGSTSTEGSAKIARLVAIEENNSLLFYGTEQEYQVIREALRQIDVLPRQVMIEAILAEVTLNDNLRYGVQWFFDSGENTVTLSAADTGSVASQFPGFSYVYSGRADARVVLNALQSKTQVRILSAPKLSVLNNQKASLQVGDQVPIVTQTSQSTDAAGAPVVSTIQMRDTGVILEVTPRVNDNGNVILDVMQEVSEVAQTTSSGIDSPTIQRRKIHSVVATRDGFTVALGGLIRENGGRGNSGVPLLKDIPVLGNLFRNNTVDTRRTELVVLLVPHVMRNQSETQSVVDALVDGLEAASSLAEHARPIAPIKTK